MKASFHGHSLPESPGDAGLLSAWNLLKFYTCRKCGKGLAEFDAASSPAGWRETQISGLCEGCFDRLLRDPGDAEPEDHTREAADKESYYAAKYGD